MNSIYLLYGEEKFLLEESVRKLKKSFGELMLGINYIVLNESNINQLISNIETPAFGYERKLIIAKNTKLFKKEGNADGLRDSINNYIKENINLINQSVILVFIEDDVDSRLTLVKTLKQLRKCSKV